MVRHLLWIGLGAWLLVSILACAQANLARLSNAALPGLTYGSSNNLLGSLASSSSSQPHDPNC